MVLTPCCNVRAETVRVVGAYVTRCTACKRHVPPSDIWAEIHEAILARSPVLWCPLFGEPETQAARVRGWKETQ